MRFSVAANFDDRLIDRISPYPVEDIYGKLSSDFTGGGRASYTTQGIDAPLLKAHLKYAHSKGIKFTYLLNSACLGNREWSKSGMRAIRGMLDWVSSIGVDAVTVSVPYLAELVKRHYPKLSLKIGIFANIDSPERALFWQDLGADMLTLESLSVNRDFTALKAIRKTVSCRLQLIANFLCLSRCPMQAYHMAGLSHGSAQPDRVPFFDYSALKCSYRFLKDPSQLIRSQWIRPEDIKSYEELGYDDFKLLERNAPTEVMADRVKAYARRKSPPNLLELLQPYGYDKEVRRTLGWKFRRVFSLRRLGLAGLRELDTLMRKRGLLYAIKDVPLFLNSRKIPADFLETIADAPCASGDGCAECGYCRKISGEAYFVDPGYRDECLRLYEKVFERICSR